MRRREFSTFFGGVAAASPNAAKAQQIKGPSRTGVSMLGVVAGASMFFAVGASSADPYRWCSVDSTGGGTNCGFVTIEQCRATISGRGGFCEPKQVIPQNLSPAAKFAAPKTDSSGGNGRSLMDCVTTSCKINCSPNVAKRFRPKWCVYFKEPV
ncbi:MAG TPA: DUF3551 domain-containing protein [Pseudolabrys sp.]|jgi:hypothetical protein|nr:DUF3551 domain-containing protein [Pseudolabrys sp.]